MTSQDLNQTLVQTGPQTGSHLGRRRVQRVRRVLFPSRTKRPNPRPEPDLVQRGLLLLWALLCLQIYTEDTDLQSQGPELPDAEPQDGASILGTAEGGVWVELWRVHATDDQRQCVVA